MKFKRQFGILIRILRSDNAREYLSHSFNTFMKSKMTFFTKLHVLIHLNKIGWLSARIDILLKLLVLF